MQSLQKIMKYAILCNKQFYIWNPCSMDRICNEPEFQNAL